MDSDRFLVEEDSVGRAAAGMAARTADEQVRRIVVARIPVDVVGLTDGPAVRQALQRLPARLALTRGATDGLAAGAIVGRVAVASAARIPRKSPGLSAVRLAGR